MALACDYDGTIAEQGIVPRRVVEALENLRRSGRRLILVTGRELADLESVFPQTALFDRVVAENGAVLFDPATRALRLLGQAPPEAFVMQLRKRGVQPLGVGNIIVSTWKPHETTVLEVIRDLGLEHQVIFNKGAVMILPPGVNKSTGLCAALDELGLSAHNVVGVGDAENDHAFLSQCECAVAVANALPSLRDKADLVTNGDHGSGVIELIGCLLDDDLRRLEARLRRHEILLGSMADGQLSVKPYGENLLVAGPSGSGKSTLVTGFLERLAEAKYQYCLIDPEGDYQNFEGAVNLGDVSHEPGIEQVMQVLRSPESNAVVNLLGVKLADRPQYFTRLLTALLEMRVRTARPHWLIVDEAHHLLPSSWDPAPVASPDIGGGWLLITVHPDHVAPAVLSSIRTIIAVGSAPGDTLTGFADALKLPHPALEGVAPEAGEAVAWFRNGQDRIVRYRFEPPRAERRRHQRKYAHGELGADKSFYFRGPEQKLNLRAYNLMVFLQMAEGVDEDTWLFHLRNGDYSRWFRESIKDEDLAREVERIEQSPAVSAQESRASLKKAIEERYTAPE